MKNKGFTIIELAISFCMVAAISITLFQLVLSMRDLYLSGNIKTTLLNKQGILSKRIYDDMTNYNLKSVNSCGISCLKFTYLDVNSNETKEAELSLDPHNVSITYDNYTVKLDNASYFGKISITDNKNIYSNSTLKNSIINIKIPIYNKLVSGDYGIDITYQYNNNATSINRSASSNMYIMIDNQKIDVIKEDGKYYAKIFYHNIAGNNVFQNKDEFLKNSNQNKYSSLFALDIFKGKYNSSNNKTFEFMLKYPSFDLSSSNKWYQESNFLKEGIKGYEPIDIMWNANWNGVGHFNGINLLTTSNTCGFAIMTNEQSSNCYMTLGAKKAISNKLMFRSDTDYTSNDVALYVRVDEYISTYGLSTVN